MDTLQAIITHRAVRHFTHRPIPDDALTHILQAGRWAGSAKNVQPWQFIVVREREMLNRLAECGRFASHLRGAALAIVIVTEPTNWATLDAGRAGQNMMLAAHAEGIGSCIAALHDQAMARATLGVPQDLQIQMAISFGYPLANAPQTIEGKPREEILARIGRKSLDEIVHWNKW